MRLLYQQAGVWTSLWCWNTLTRTCPPTCPRPLLLDLAVTVLRCDLLTYLTVCLSTFMHPLRQVSQVNTLTQSHHTQMISLLIHAT